MDQKIAFAIAAIFVGIAYLVFLSGCIQPEPIACTMEAKLCPDGSAVGRNSELNCEFDACPSVGPLRIVLDQNVFAEASNVHFTLFNDSNNSVFLPGCQAFLFELFINEKWVPAQTIECVWEGYGKEIKAGASEQFSFLANGNGTARIVINASTGCVSGKPLSQANCTGNITAVSETFNITPASLSELQNCNVNSDCWIINADCCGCNQGGKRVAINSVFEHAFSLNLGCEKIDIACIQVISNDPSCDANATVECTNGKCVIS